MPAGIGGAHGQQPIRKGDGIVQGLRAGVRLQNDGAAVSSNGGGADGQRSTAPGALIFDGLVAGAEGFELIARGDVVAHGNLRLFREVLETSEIQRPIEDDARFDRADSIGQHRLGKILVV